MSIRSCRIGIVLVALSGPLPCRAESPAVPAEAAFLTQWGAIHQDAAYEDWGVETIPAYGANQAQRSGHHWKLSVAVPGFKFGDRAALWASVKPYVLKAGWEIISENPNGGMLIVLHYKKNGVDAWASAGTDNPATRFYANIIEVVPPAVSLTLKEPAPIFERFDPRRDDFPFLAPLPGSEKRGGAESETPLWLTPKGAAHDEIVANGSMERGYSLPGLSKELFARVYRDALVKAGWSIERETANSEVLVAHYSKNGRNLWAYLLCHGADYTLRVGKEAAPDQIKAGLAKDCHVAVYGVLFEYNQATLRPASRGPLGQVAALMAANPSLKIEIQGHTDISGADQYNQNLSQARAHSVMTWLTAHGVAAGRMTANGYGATRPIADNKTDEGRMKNRRVEIWDPTCRPKD